MTMLMQVSAIQFNSVQFNSNDKLEAHAQRANRHGSNNAQTAQ